VRILIVYGTTEGQTEKIARDAKAHLAAAGHEIQAVDADDIQTDFDIFPFDAAIIAASVHQWQHQTNVVDFVIKHREWLEGKPTAFISVSLSEAFEDDRDEARAYIDQFIDETGWTPGKTLSLAGALRYKEYDFMRRWVMRWMAGAKGAPTDTTKDYEYTDWEQLHAFLDDFAGSATTKDARAS
jgi:menaquinone-dependent protoporphyrinogen oxidase